MTTYKSAVPFVSHGKPVHGFPLFSRHSTMLYLSSLLFLSTILCTSRIASGLGTSCTAPLSGGTAAPTDPYWLGSITHLGTSPFNPDASTYQVFRNVIDFGAAGDGVTDDTDAIKQVISPSSRRSFNGGSQCGHVIWKSLR